MKAQGFQATRGSTHMGNGNGTNTNQGGVTSNTSHKPPQPAVVAAAAAVGGLIGGIVGALIGSGMHP
jgi:hypothetical protein